MNEPKICPLLTIADQGTLNDCLEDRCAWYIPPDHPSLQPEGRCAITYLSSIAHGVRNI